MKKFSNTYIFLYITALVTVIAVVLTLVSTGLKPRRDRNKEAEKCQQILRAAGHDIDRSKAVDAFSNLAVPLTDDGRQYQIVCADGTKGIAIRLDGKGLWGPIWGYAVLSEDGKTVKGVCFDHKSETPGLGAKITDEAFMKSFEGKKLYDKDGNYVSVRVLKPGTSAEVAEENRVDAISGATITSRGVDQMMKEELVLEINHF
ncbi:MAG: FMN-binding protein [Bacteroidales bacterium]|jgi:Na+-transporting NADH:ubiquinone oxidoreductase subunit C|nr:FMN-binding protein [Bacteroidales bacterium]